MDQPNSSLFGDSKTINQPNNTPSEKKPKAVYQIILFGASQNITQYTVSLFGAPKYTEQLYTKQISAENISFVFGDSRNIYQGSSFGISPNLAEITVSVFGTPKLKKQRYKRSFESISVALENPKSIHCVSPFSVPVYLKQLFYRQSINGNTILSIDNSGNISQFSVFGAPKPLPDFASIRILERLFSPRFEFHPFAISPRFVFRPSFSDDQYSDKSDDNSDSSDSESQIWSIKNNYRNPDSLSSNSLSK